MRPASPRGPSGAALLATLWAIGILAFAMISLGLLVDTMLAQQASYLTITRALLAAESGLAMMRNPAVNEFNCPEATRQLNAVLYGGKNKSAGDGPSFEVSVTREGALLDLNRLATNPVVCTEVLGRLFKLQWEVDPDIADRAANALVDWVDEDDARQLNGAENREYEKAGRPGPRNSPMLGREEFFLIAGWQELQQVVRARGIDLRSRFTVNGAEKLDLSVADGDLIEALLGLAPGASRNFLAQRLGLDQLAGTPDDVRDPVAAAALLGVSVSLLNDRATLTGRMRVISTGRVGATVRTIEAVLSEGPTRRIEARWLQ